MNDYWNYPPETDELPECCGDYMDFDEKTAVCTCPKCGKRIEPQRDPEPADFGYVPEADFGNILEDNDQTK